MWQQVTTFFGQTLHAAQLHEAILKGDIKQVSVLLKLKGAQAALNQPDSHGDMALHLACRALSQEEYFSHYYQVGKGVRAHNFAPLEKTFVAIITLLLHAYYYEDEQRII